MEHTPSMLSETHTQRILDLASRRGLLRASDLDAISSPRVILTRMTPQVSWNGSGVVFTVCQAHR